MKLSTQSNAFSHERWNHANFYAFWPCNHLKIIKNTGFQTWGFCKNALKFRALKLTAVYFCNRWTFSKTLASWLLMQDVFSVIKMAGIWEFVAQTSTKNERIARFSPSWWPYMEVVDRRCENASKTFQTTLVWLGRRDEKIETPPYLPAPAPTQPTGKNFVI